MSPELITALVSLVGGGIGVKIIDWIIAWTKGGWTRRRRSRSASTQRPGAGVKLSRPTTRCVSLQSKRGFPWPR